MDCRHRDYSRRGPGFWRNRLQLPPRSSERPGANDNGSGCVTILESARMLAGLSQAGALPRPKRTLRFVWGPEVEGTMAFLASHPEIRRRISMPTFTWTWLAAIPSRTRPSSI